MFKAGRYKTGAVERHSHVDVTVAGQSHSIDLAAVIGMFRARCGGVTLPYVIVNPAVAPQSKYSRLHGITGLAAVC